MDTCTVASTVMTTVTNTGATWRAFTEAQAAAASQLRAMGVSGDDALMAGLCVALQTRGAGTCPSPICFSGTAPGDGACSCVLLRAPTVLRSALSLGASHILQNTYTDLDFRQDPAHVRSGRLVNMARKARCRL